MFQNDLMEIFKKIVERDHIKPRYVISVITEYIRTLMEANIPQQPQLQSLLLNFLIQTRQFTQLHFLLQFHIMSESLALARVLIALGQKSPLRNIQLCQGHTYTPGFQLGLDMMVKLGKNDGEIVEVLMQEGHISKALDYAVERHLKQVPFDQFMKHVDEVEDYERKQALQRRIADIRKII